MLMTAMQDFLILVPNVYSFSSTFSILIQGFPSGPPLLKSLIMLNKDTKIMGIQRIDTELSTTKIRIIGIYKTATL